MSLCIFTVAKILGSKADEILTQTAHFARVLDLQKSSDERTEQEWRDLQPFVEASGSPLVDWTQPWIPFVVRYLDNVIVGTSTFGNLEPIVESCGVNMMTFADCGNDMFWVLQCQDWEQFEKTFSKSMSRRVIASQCSERWLAQAIRDASSAWKREAISSCILVHCSVVRGTVTDDEVRASFGGA